MKLNVNTVLAILGGLGIFAPDVAGLATWLATLRVSWLSYPIRGLGGLAVFFAAAPLVVPRLRSFLALLGLATPPGQLAPWTPGKDVPANVATVVPTSEQITPPKGVVVKTQLPPTK